MPREKDQFKWIFEYSPVAIWAEDFSALAKLRDQLKKQKVKNVREYLSQNKDLVIKTFRQIKILDVNKAAVKLYGAKNKKEVIANLGKKVPKGVADVLIDEFATLLEGRDFETEFKSKTLYGQKHDVLMRVSIPEPYRGSFKRVLVSLEDITPIKKLQAQLKRVANLDGLTGLLNQKAIKSRMEEEVLRAKRYKEKLSCMMIDLDFFKSVNDTQGHQKGDKLLKDVASLLKKSIRKVDIVGRYGGDEFLIILPETPPINAKIPALRIQVKMFQKLRAYPDVTMSIGICGYPCKGVNDFKDLIAKADEAMYRSKSLGRNRIEVF